MQARTKTLALAAGGIVALGGVTFFFWKIGRAPSPGIQAEVPARDAGERAEPTVTRDASAPSKPAVADAPPSPECAALRSANDAMIRKFEKHETSKCYVIPPDVGCVTTPKGVTWGYRIARIHAEKSSMSGNEDDHEKGPCSTEHEMDLVRQDRAGTKVLAGGKETLTYDWGTKQNAITFEPLIDYDGNGEEEILRIHDALGHEGSPSHDVTVLTFKDGNVRPYPPAADLSIEEQSDVDGDGRPDLLSSGPYVKVESSDVFGNGWRAVSSLFVHHSRPDGTFALNDDDAIAYTRSRCPSAPNKVDISLDDTTGMKEHDAAADALVCARLWGVSPQKIEQAWNAICKDIDAEANPFACQTWPNDLAAVTPPFQLR